MKRLQLLDYGRFLATLAVMAYHYIYNGIKNGKISSIEYWDPVSSYAPYGHFGVQFFFMISGFVIFYSALDKKASQFALSRFKRLYPLFWTGLIFTSIVAYFWGKGTLMEVSLKQIVANISMMPELFGQKNVDGVYWTLAWELKFYLLVFLLLLFGLGRHLSALFVVWAYYLLVTYLLKIQPPYSAHHFVFFVAGALFATYKNSASWTTIPSLLICYFLSVAKYWTVSEPVQDPMVNACIITFLYLFFCFLLTEHGQKMELYQSSLLGALTYPVYLIHAHFGYMFLSQFANEDNKFYVYAIVLVLVFIIAYLMNLVVVQKLSSFWTMFFKRTVEMPISFLEQNIEMARLKWIAYRRS